jgi:hypothetical protein
LKINQLGEAALERRFRFVHECQSGVQMMQSQAVARNCAKGESLCQSVVSPKRFWGNVAHLMRWRKVTTAGSMAAMLCRYFQRWSQGESARKPRKSLLRKDDNRTGGKVRARQSGIAD